MQNKGHSLQSAERHATPSTTQLRQAVAGVSEVILAAGIIENGRSPKVETQIIIDAELAALLPPLAEVNRAELKRSLLGEGRCLDPIYYWTEENILLDGHARLQIIQEIRAKENPNFPDPEAKPISFKSRTEAKDWCLRWQLGRRSGFDNFAMISSYVSDGELMESLTKSAQQRMKNGKKNDPVLTSEQGRTVEILAKKIGIGKQAVHEAMQVLKNPEITTAVRGGQITCHQAYKAIQSEKKRQQENNRVADNHKRLPAFTKKKFVNAVHLIDVFDGLDRLADASVDLVIFSPPYPLTQVRYPTPEPFYTGNYDEYLAKMDRIFSGLKRIVKPGGRIIVNFDNVNIPDKERTDKRVRFDLRQAFANLAEAHGFIYTDEYIWAKQNAVGTRPAIGTRGSPVNPRVNNNTEYVVIWANQKVGIDKQPDELNDLTNDEHFELSMQLWGITPASRPSNGEGHRCAFPEELVERLIKLYSYRKQVVLDPFSGSGTTCAVAARLGRQFIGFDAAEKYHRIARKRVADAIREARALAKNPPAPAKAMPTSRKSINNSARLLGIRKISQADAKVQ